MLLTFKGQASNYSTKIKYQAEANIPDSALWFYHLCELETRMIWAYAVKKWREKYIIRQQATKKGNKKKETISNIWTNKQTNMQWQSVVETQNCTLAPQNDKNLV